MINRMNTAESRFSKWFLLVAMLAVTTVIVFMTNQITQAQRPDRSEMRDRRGGGMRGARGGGGFSPNSLIDSSWSDLTFVVKVDNETLIKARPVYQKSRDSLEKAMKAARETGDRGAMRTAMMEVRESFESELNDVLTEEQSAKLDALQQKRMEQMRGGRPGGRGRGQ